MGWQHCIEIFFFGLFIVIALATTVWAIAAIFGAWRATARNRRPWVPAKSEPQKDLTPEQRASVERQWEDIRTRATAYAKDLNLSANEHRRAALESIKESGLWARLAIQYALVGNGAALVALPYLLSQLTNYTLPLGDAKWSAYWFALGGAAAALCCLVVYLDYQITAAIYWGDWDLEINLARQRHYENSTTVDYEGSHHMRNQLRAVNLVTGWSGVVFGVLTWMCLGWGVLRLMMSLIT